MIKKIDDYFANEYVSTDEDEHVVELVKKAKNALDVGCGDNLFKKHGLVTGIDPFNKNADIMCDILDYDVDMRFDLIICFGSINFYDLAWVDARMKKVFSLLSLDGRICMKVNPCKPFANGVKLDWFDKWTPWLAYHYADVNNMWIDEQREGEDGRFKFDFVSKQNIL